LLLGLVGNGRRVSSVSRSRSVNGVVWIGSVGGVVSCIHSGMEEGALLPCREGESGGREEEGGGEDGEEEEKKRKIEEPRHENMCPVHRGL